MKKIIRQILPGLAATAMLFGASHSWADTTIYTYHSVQPETLAEWSHAFVFPQFNPSLGLLEAVRITASYDITTSGSVSNTDQSSKVFWFQAGSLLSLNLPGSLGVLEVSPFADEVHFKLPKFGSATYGAFSTNGSVEITLSGTDLAPFLGTGNLDFLGQTSTQEALRDIINGGGGKIDISLITTASATITLEYLDAPVPEPSSAALLVLGLFLFLRKRR